MAKTHWVAICFLVFVVAALSIVFTVDDVTVIGQFLDPLEYAFVGVVGYYGAKMVPKIK